MLSVNKEFWWVYDGFDNLESWIWIWIEVDRRKYGNHRNGGDAWWNWLVSSTESGSAPLYTWMKRGFNACKTLCCIYPSIFNHFGDIAIGGEYWSKIATFSFPLYLAAPQGVTPLEFREYLDTHKTRMNGLSCGEESMTIFSAVLIQYQRVTDRRTDGQTDGETSSL